MFHYQWRRAFALSSSSSSSKGLWTSPSCPLSEADGQKAQPRLPKSAMLPRCKPPNILILEAEDDGSGANENYPGRGGANENGRLFARLRHRLLRAGLNREKYLIYPHKESANLKILPENTALFICPHRPRNRLLVAGLRDYFGQGGLVVGPNLLSCEAGSRTDSNFSRNRPDEGHLDASRSDETAEVWSCSNSNSKNGANAGRWITLRAGPRAALEMGPREWADLLRKYFPSIELEEEAKVGDDDADDDAEVTGAVLYGESRDLAAFRALSLPPGQSVIQRKDVALDFGVSSGAATPPATPTYLPVRFHDDQGHASSSSSFDWPAFKSELRTRRLGRLLLHSPVMTTSFAPLAGPAQLWDGMAVVPDRQTAGVGRGGNRWLSPPGCAMMSLQLRVSLKSALAQRLSLVQHLVGLACVHAVRSQPGCRDVTLNLKWPNDLYAGPKVKVGGVVIFSSILGSQVDFTIGLGVNLSNEEPTVCINQLIRSQLSRERYLARVLNQLETFLDKMEEGEAGRREVMDLYYKYWLHQDQPVTVSENVNLDDDGERQSGFEGVVVGLDEHGFLLVRKKEKEGGRVVTVLPDGNSFDMMQGLIMSKER